MRRTGIFLKRSGLFSVFSEVRCAKCSLFLVAIFFLLHSHIINRSVYVDVFLMICIVLMQFRHWPNWAWGCSLHHCTSRDGNLYISETLPQTQRGDIFCKMDFAKVLVYIFAFLESLPSLQVPKSGNLSRSTMFWFWLLHGIFRVGDYNDHKPPHWEASTHTTGCSEQGC